MQHLMGTVEHANEYPSILNPWQKQNNWGVSHYQVQVTPSEVKVEILQGKYIETQEWQGLLNSISPIIPDSANQTLERFVCLFVCVFMYLCIYLWKVYLEEEIGDFPCGPVAKTELPVQVAWVPPQSENDHSEDGRPPCCHQDLAQPDKSTNDRCFLEAI